MGGAEISTSSKKTTYIDPTDDVPSLLKHATRPIHQQIERELGLVASRVDLARYRRILAGFYGLYAVWEPAAHRAVSRPELTSGRVKLPTLARDLAALGVSPDKIRVWPGDAALASPAAGLGAMYVMEGATLGGQVISRALESNPQIAGACTFFQSYGANAGAMWRAFLDHLRTTVPPENRAEIVATGVRTFQAFRDWLIEERA